MPSCVTQFSKEIVALATLSGGYGGGDILEDKECKIEEDVEDPPLSGGKALRGPGLKASCPVATYGALEVRKKKRWKICILMNA